MEKILEIYLGDLKEEKQKEVRDFLLLGDEGNAEIFPIFVLTQPDYKDILEEEGKFRAREEYNTWKEEDDKARNLKAENLTEED